MADFFELTVDERREALAVAAAASGRPIHLLEKDKWAVWALAHLFGSPFADHLVFKGGTSLSKAYSVISRFSEDVNVTYDIRAIASDLIGGAESPCRPPAARRNAGRKKSAHGCRNGCPKACSLPFPPPLQSKACRRLPEQMARRPLSNTQRSHRYGYVSRVVMLECDEIVEHDDIIAR